MQVRIKSLHLENFKGVKTATYRFCGKNASVIGQNGAGKTTLFTAYIWLMADKDSDLKSNPNIRPLETEECTTMVKVVFDIDGREVTATKIQKYTVKKGKNGGADTISLSNSYEVNSVEYGERDFKKKMQEYGFDFDLFLPLSHPDVFTSQKSADMRKVLFGMASEQSDKEIANMTDGATEVAEMLSNYTAEEVKAMQNATLRKIREEYGKDGEILRAKIEGMEQSKTDIDVAELELLKNSLNEQIAENKAKQEDISKEFEEQQKASDGILELKFELNDLQRKANEENNRKKSELDNNITDIQVDIKKASNEAFICENNIKTEENILKSHQDGIEKERENYRNASSIEFNTNELICPMCKREYEQEKQQELRDSFDKNKAETLARITDNGNYFKTGIEQCKQHIEELKKEKKKWEDKIFELQKSLNPLADELEKLPDSIDISDRPEVQEIQRQIAEKEQAMNKGNSAEEIRQDLRFELNDLQNHLVAIEKRLALAQKNIQIDEDISKLREKQKSFEQQKADCERILDQLDMVSKRKNELLTDRINSHFKMVKFRLFDYLKNGSVVDDCEPTIDGKSLKDHSNGALRVLAKLDILSGLQEFYNQHYPVFVDDYSLVTENTDCRLGVDFQIIKLKAFEGVKELKIMEG